MKIRVQATPLSVNKAYQGRRFKTKEHKDFCDEVGWQLNRIPIVKGEVEISYEFYLKHYKRTDVDNLIKPIQDVLVQKEIISDDRYVRKVTAEKFPINGYEEDVIFIEIKKYGDSKN